MTSARLSAPRIAPALGLALGLFFLATLTRAPGEEVSYARDVAPILRAYCAGCHNNGDYEGDFSLETHAQLVKGVEGAHKPTVLPGQPGDSHLIKVIEGRAKPKMPPRDEPRPSTADIAVLNRWIAEGANAPAEDASILSSLVVPDIPSATTIRPITAAASADHGRIQAMAKFGQIELASFDPTTSPFLPARTLTTPPGKLNSLAFSPDTKRLLAGSGITGLKGTALIWELEKPDAPPFEISAGRDLVYDAEFSPDGALIATAGYDRAIRIFDTATRKLLRQIDGHKGAVFDLAFHPSGEALASASADGTVKLWRVNDGLRLDTLAGPAAEQFAVTFTRDGKHLLAAGADNRIRMWKVTGFDTPQIQPLVHARFAHEGAIEQLALAPGGGQLVSAADNRSLKLWSLPDLQQIHAYETQSDSVTGIIMNGPLPEKFKVTRMDGLIEEYALTGKSEATAGAATDAPSKPEASGAGRDDMQQLAESEPNNAPKNATPLPIPAEITGSISSPTDRDIFQFNADAGQQFVFEINAARSKSKLDSKLEILHADGSPVEQVVLQAVRDSWFTFRGKDSSTSDDFRLHNWREMELNELLYANGEVVKLWHYPRGPDSGFKTYPGFGKRQTYFQTTPVSHALGEPAYIVRPLPADSNPAPNGLPLYRLYYENDDDPQRQLGSDSRLMFTAPTAGDFLIRVSDVRFFGAAENFHYTLTARRPHPDFQIAITGKDPKLAPSSGKELLFTATRKDGFDGAIRIDISGLPEGYLATTPVTIEAGHLRAYGSIFAKTDAKPLAPEDSAGINIIATASSGGKDLTRNLGSLGTIELTGDAKLTVSVNAMPEGSDLMIHPGETIFALAKANRRDFKALIDFGKDDSGKSLPHGVYVDNIGLNGLMIVAGQSERQFAITAAPWVQPGEHQFFLSTKADGGRTSAPIKLRVLGAR